MGSRSAPIEIAPASGHSSPRSPPHTSNLTSALRTTSGNEAKPTPAMDVNGLNKGYGSGFGGSATGSYLGTAAQPISVNSSGREKPRRESLASSMITGMSYGGNSVGSWIRDEYVLGQTLSSITYGSLTFNSIIMQGTSPFNYKSPSFHSDSYLPKLEANFMRDFICCGLTLPTLHDLLQHYEETHSDRVPPNLQRQTLSQNSTRPDAKAAHAAVAASNIQSQGGTQQKPPKIDTSTQEQITTQRSSTPVTPRHSNQAQQVTRGFTSTQPSLSHDDETVGDMELDDDFGTMPTSTQQPPFTMQTQPRLTQQSQFGQPATARVPSLDMSTLNIGNQLQQQHQGLRNSQPATPVSASRSGSIYQNNPTVSSVNTPTFSTHSSTHPLQQQYYTPQSSAPGTPGEPDPEFMSDLGSINMGGMQYRRNPHYGYPVDLGHDMLDLCIDEPAKRLFARNGGHAADYAQSQQPATTSSASQLGDGQYSENSDIARTIREAQKDAGVPDPSVDGGVPKPFHCPVIGCEKAYKNQNGLKYHKSVSQPSSSSVAQVAKNIPARPQLAKTNC